MSDVVKAEVSLMQYSDMQDMLRKLNYYPKKKWVKWNKHAKIYYIPIGILERMLWGFFGAWECEIIDGPKILGNSIVTSVALHVWCAPLGRMLKYPGVGAVPIQLEKGSNPLDFEKMRSTAIQINAPASLAYAKKNAAKNLGRVFGAGLNSKERYEVEK